MGSIQLALLIFLQLHLAIFIQNISFIIRLGLFCGFGKTIIDIKAWGKLCLNEKIRDDGKRFDSSTQYALQYLI